MTNEANPRVLMIGPSLSSRGGMATVERQLVERLPKAGIQVKFISTYDDCGKIKKAFIAFSAYIQFCRSMRDADVLHVHMASRGSFERKSIFLRTAKNKDLKTVVHLHGGEFGVWFDDEVDEKKRCKIRDLFNSVDAVVVLSEEWENWLVSRGFSPKRLVVVHNAVSVPDQSCSPCSHRDVLFLGRLDARKSPDVLLRASRPMLEQHPDAKLIFGGDGFPERYKALACELGISERCEFLGWITGEQKEKLFKRAGVYCLPSKNEGMPMSVLEAMAHGIPTIATSVGGVPQVIENGVNGYLMDVDDEKTLSKLLCMLIDDSSLRAEIGMAGRTRITRDFNIDSVIDCFYALYRGLFV